MAPQDPFDRHLEDDPAPEQTDNGPRPDDGDQPDEDLQQPGTVRTDFLDD